MKPIIPPTVYLTIAAVFCGLVVYSIFSVAAAVFLALRSGRRTPGDFLEWCRSGNAAQIWQRMKVVQRLAMVVWVTLATLILLELACAFLRS